MATGSLTDKHFLAHMEWKTGGIDAHARLICACGNSYGHIRPIEAMRAMIQHIDDEGAKVKEKYVVTRDGSALKPGTYVVIRTHDVFAHTALATYASSIQSVIEIAKELGTPVPPYIEEVRDYFFEMAEVARTSPHKLPD